MNLTKYLIFGKTIYQAKQYLHNNILPNIPTDQISRHYKSYNQESILLNDGTIYKVISALDHVRGNRCHKAYVSYDVNKDILDRIIKPCIIGNGLDDSEYDLCEDRIIYY